MLSALPLFGSLDRATLNRLAAATTRRTVPRGESVFRQGERLTGMYVLVYGELRLMARHGRASRLCGVVHPRSSFGEPMMFLERPAVVSAEAVSDSLVLHVPKQAVFDELEANPLFARQMIASLSRRIESLVNDTERQALPSGRARLIDYLARHALPERDAAVVRLPGPKAIVASHLRLSPEHFSRVLHKLAADGLVQVTARRIDIPDVARLLAGVAPAKAQLRSPVRGER